MFRCQTGIMVMNMPAEQTMIFGDPQFVFQRETNSKLSDVVIDCRGWNAIWIYSTEDGDRYAGLEVHGSFVPGVGTFQRLTTPGSARGPIYDDMNWLVPVSSPFVRLNLRGVIPVATVVGQGFTIVAVPLRWSGSPVSNNWKSLVSIMPVVNFSGNGTSSTDVMAIGWADYDEIIAIMTVTNSSLAGGGTVNIYVQTTIDDGATFDDVIAFSQVNSSLGNATRIARLIRQTDDGFAPRALLNSAGSRLATGSVAGHFGDRLLVERVASSFGVNDSVSVLVQAVGIKW